MRLVVAFLFFLMSSATYAGEPLDYKSMPDPLYKADFVGLCWEKTEFARAITGQGYSRDWIAVGIDENMLFERYTKPNGIWLIVITLTDGNSCAFGQGRENEKADDWYFNPKTTP